MSYPVYSIKFIEGYWCAKETFVDENGGEEFFCGYGSTPEEALQNIRNSHQILQRLILDKGEFK